MRLDELDTSTTLESNKSLDKVELRLRRHLGATDVLSSRQTEPEAVSDWPITEPLLPLQPQHLVGLTHGLSLCRHLLLPHDVRKG